MGLLSFCPHVKGALYPRIQATWWAPYFERTPHPKTGKLKSCRRQRSLDEPAELWWTTAMLYCRTATGLRACEKLNGSMGHCAGHRSCDCDITKVPVYASIVLYFWSSSQHSKRFGVFCWFECRVWTCNCVSWSLQNQAINSERLAQPDTPKP